MKTTNQHSAVKYLDKMFQ